MTKEERENAIRILKEDKATCEYNLNKAPSAKHIGQVLKDIFESRIKAYKIAIQTLQESSKDMEEIEEIINCDADAEIKLKMISNIVHSKPHYFKVSHENKIIDEHYWKSFNNGIRTAEWRATKQEPPYCDRNICLKHEYNGISCEECEVTKRAERVFKMRDATPEEQKSVDDYIKSISKPTGVNFWNLDDNDDCISRKAVLSLLADHFDNVFDMVKELPSVAIPQDHDGCKDCKYETYPEYYYPCCECKQNYMDEWKATSSAESKESEEV